MYRSMSAPLDLRGRPSGWDVIIIGGRVAGASTALLLARAGLRVLGRRTGAPRLGHRCPPMP